MVKNAIRTIYGPRLFQRAQISEDWLLGTYIDLPADNGKTPKWKIFIPKLKPVKNIKGLIKKHIALQIIDCSCPVSWSITKKCAPYFRGNTEFPIYSLLLCLADKKYTTFHSTFYRVVQVYIGAAFADFFYLHNTYI
jgi:hypothetical protein